MKNYANSYFCIKTLSWNHGQPEGGGGRSGHCPTCYGPAAQIDEEYYFLRKTTKNSSFTKPFIVILYSIIVFILISKFNGFLELPFDIKINSILEIQSLSIFLVITFICFRGLRLSILKILFQLLVTYFIFNILRERVTWLPNVTTPVFLVVVFVFLSCWQIISRNKRRGLTVLLIAAAYIIASRNPQFITSFAPVFPTWVSYILISITFSIIFNLIFLSLKDHNLKIALKNFMYYFVFGIIGIYVSTKFYYRLDDFSLQEIIAQISRLQIVSRGLDCFFIGAAWFAPQFIEFFWGYKIRLWRLPEKYHTGLSPESALKLFQFNRIKAFNRIGTGVKYYLDKEGSTQRRAFYLAIAGAILAEWQKPELAQKLIEQSKQTIFDSPYTHPGLFFSKEYAFANYFLSTIEGYDIELRTTACQESVIIFSQLGERIWLMRSITQLAWLHFQRNETKRCSSLIKEFFRLGALDGVGENYYARMKSLRIMSENKRQGIFETGWSAALGNEIDKEISMQDFLIMRKLADYYRSEGADNTAHDHQYEVMSALASAIFRISKSIGIESTRQEFISQTRSLVEEAILLGIQLKKTWETFDTWQKFKSTELLEDLSVSYAQNPLEIINLFGEQDREDRYNDIARRLQPATIFDYRVQEFQNKGDDFRYVLHFAKSLNISQNQNDLAQDFDLLSPKFIFSALINSIFRLPKYILSRKIRQPSDFVDILKSLSKGQVILDYCVLPNRTFIMIVKKGFLFPKIHEIYINTNEDREFISTTFKNPQTIFSLNMETLQNWEKYIIPAAQYLSKGDTITFIPSDYLHYLPLHALPLNGKPLIESFAISYLPSASILRYMRLVQKRKTQKNKLVIGDPKGDLPFALLEAQKIAEIYKTNPFIGKEATSSNWDRLAKTSGLIHLATHAKFDETDDDPASFVLADKEINAQDVYISNLSCDLVVLSACQSGINRLSSGDKIYGFTSAFLYAGAKNVLVSLWPIDDNTSSSLMVHFHTLLRQGLSSKIALQLACNEMRKNNPHFYYWAPFILVGN